MASELEKSLAEEAAKKIKKLMKKGKITKIEVLYSGEGDSGEIDELAGFSGDTPLEELPKEDEIMSLSRDIIENLQPGFEINEGGGGCLTLEIVDGDLEVGLDGHYNVPADHFASLTV